MTTTHVGSNSPRWCIAFCWPLFNHKLEHFEHLICQTSVQSDTPMTRMAIILQGENFSQVTLFCIYRVDFQVIVSGLSYLRVSINLTDIQINISTNNIIFNAWFHFLTHTTFSAFPYCTKERIIVPQTLTRACGKNAVTAVVTWWHLPVEVKLSVVEVIVDYFKNSHFNVHLKNSCVLDKEQWCKYGTLR